MEGDKEEGRMTRKKGRAEEEEGGEKKETDKKETERKTKEKQRDRENGRTIEM